MTSDPREAKRAIRADIRHARTHLSSADKASMDAALTAAQIAVVESLHASTIATYLSAPDEPDTRGLLAWCRDHHVRALLPIIRQDGLLDWAEFDETETEGPYGVPEPKGEILPPNVIHEAELILVPASAVDRSGERLGWGRGYFDKTLGSMERCPPVLAVVYESEILDSVPTEPHDHAVDGAITEHGRTDFTKG